MKRLFLFVLVVLAYVVVTAAKATDSATQIATLIIVAAPFVLPLLGKFFPLDGKKMLAIMYVLSVGTAFAAAYIGGLFSGLDTVPGIVAFGSAVFGLQQLVYQALNQSGTFVIGSVTVDPTKLVN